MNGITREDITEGVLGMLRVNMGLKAGESLLVMTDVARPVDWLTDLPSIMAKMSAVTLLARLVADVASEQFPRNRVVFLPFPATGRHGAEPGDEAARMMHEADVVVALTYYSVSHTNARTEASASGTRVASMPGFEARMFAAGGPMAVDYHHVAADCRRFAELLSGADQVVIRSPHGTDLQFSLTGRRGESDDGILDLSGRFGNLPAGEAYAVPVEGSAQGQLVTPAGWFPSMTEDLVMRVEHGLVMEVRGGGLVGDQLGQVLDCRSGDPAIVARRNIAELGIGTNPNARQPDNVLEAEKIKGTVHIGVGDNVHMGGRVEADFHEDFVQPAADLILDGVPVIVGGEWKI